MDPAVVARINALVIPPAWQDVWICPWPNGHLQAVGTDAAGRRQYRYHDAWRVQRDQAKFARLLEFGQALPALRRRVARDLSGRGLNQSRVTALGVRLLDVGCFRVGNTEYADEHETFGVATLRTSHVTVRRQEVEFDYAAKGSIARRVSVRDPEVRRAVASLCRRRGPDEELLAWINRGTWVNISATDINAYLKAHAGPAFSAKDFRTWTGTVAAAVELARVPEPLTSQRARRRAETDAVAAVACLLGNTPAVCRSSYIDPRVIDRFEAGDTIRSALSRLGGQEDPYQIQCGVEPAVLRLLVEEASAAA